jgi:hypothetical protein
LKRNPNKKNSGGLNQPSYPILGHRFVNTLFVADYLNHRVMMFFAVHLKGDSANADLVLGQPDFVTCTPACSQSR